MNGLLDFLQGASNAAASNVTAPVDLINWLLQKAGLPVSQAPVGGSAWAEQKGLTKKPQNALLGMGGETAGLLSPVVAAAKAPQIAKGLLQMGENAAAPRTLNPQTGAIVWHGSPHKFDRFDSSKIGTGEGAQAYGHGLYLAENPSVATEYRRTLSAGVPEVLVNGRRVAGTPFNSAANTLALSRDRITRDDLAAHLQSRIDELGASSDPLARAALLEAKKAKASLDKARDVVVNYDGTAGSLYKVDLPDPVIARMLDWDKPLSQQAPGVRQTLTDALASSRDPWIRGSARTWAEHPHAATGADVYRGVDKLRADQGVDGWMPTAELLRSAGIPGIRYLDGGSRGAGAGTSNFVVFPGEENILTILERNGIPLR